MVQVKANLLRRIGLLVITLSGVVLSQWRQGPVPSLGASLLIQDALKELRETGSLLGPGDWMSCEPKMPVPDRLVRVVPLGITARFDCPAAVKWALSMESWETASDSEVFWAGYALLRDGRSDTAVLVWRNRPAVASHLMSLARQNEAEFEVMESLTTLAVDVRPDDPDLWRQRGLRLRAEKPELAAEAFGRMVDLAPHDYQGYLRLGHLRMTQGEFSQAIALCERATELGIDSLLESLRAWFCLGRAAFYEKDWDVAERAFLTRLELQPEDSQTLFWLGRTYRYAGEVEKAEFYLRRAITAAQEQSASPASEAFAWYELGHVLKSQDRRQEAATAFGRVLDLHPAFLYAEDASAQLRSLEADGPGAD